MTKTKSIFILILVWAGTLTAPAQSSTPVASVQSFYAFDRAHSQTFNRQNVNARKRWLSPELSRLFDNELRRQDALLKKSPTDKPYFGDGFPFQPLQEACDGAGKQRLPVVKQDFRKGNRAAVTVTFSYPRSCKAADPFTYTIGIVRKGGGWLIDDLNTGEDHSLKEVLSRRDY